jgi:uncharacterized protein (TIGR00369 family)
MTVSSGYAVLPVSDFDRAIEFYSDRLGLQLVLRLGDEWACLQGGDLMVGLVPVEESTNGRPAVALVIDESIGAVVQDLRRQGIEVADPVGEVVRVAELHDPDGNRLQLTDAPADPRAGFAGQHGGDRRLFFDHLGLRWDTREDGRVSVEIDLRDDLRGPAGIVQGGVTATLVDVAAATTAALSGTQLMAASELTIHYLTPGKVGPIRAIGELLRSGERVLAAEVRVHDVGSDNRLIAVGLVSMLPLDRRQHEQAVLTSC